MTIPSSGAFFTTYEALKHALDEFIPPNSTLYVPQPAIHSISSAGAELVSCAIITPAEVIKQNAQIVRRNQGSSGFSPTIEVFRNFRRQPVKLWRGYTALAARNLPFTALQFPMFEQLKGYMMARQERKKGRGPVDGIFERAGLTGLSAAMAGSVAAWITTPIDVVKTRIMLAAGDETAKARSEAPSQTLQDFLKKGLGRKSGWQVGRDIMQHDGLRGLFRGGLLRSLWTAMGSGLYLGCYEAGRHYLERSRKNNRKEEGGFLMGKDLKDVKVGIGRSRSQEMVKKSAWQEE